LCQIQIPDDISNYLRTIAVNHSNFAQNLTHFPN
jgi:hypothetical protein